MRAVSVSELKAKLSRCLREDRRGGEVQVLHRGFQVAMLTGLPKVGRSAGDQLRQQLIEAGVLRPGRARTRWSH